MGKNRSEVTGEVVVKDSLQRDYGDGTTRGTIFEWIVTHEEDTT